MNSTELYQFAYKLHYNSNNYEEAYKIYNKIIKDFEDSKEANYARSQIENIKKLNLELDDNTNSEMLNEYVSKNKKNDVKKDITLMNPTELYQFAYKLHYNYENYIEAYKIYNKIIKEFEDTKEANYARSQIDNIKKLNLELDDSDINSEILNEYISENKKNKHPNKFTTDTTKIIITTSNSIDGYVIDKYINIINSQTVLGTGLFSEINMGISDIFGERSDAFEDKLSQLNISAINDIKLIASRKGGNAVIGIHFDYTVFAGNGLGVVLTGTVVSIKEKEDVQIENIPNMIEKMFELKNKQIITEEEYEEKRKVLLNKIK